MLTGQKDNYELRAFQQVGVTTKAQRAQKGWSGGAFVNFVTLWLPTDGAWKPDQTTKPLWLLSEMAREVGANHKSTETTNGLVGAEPL